MTKNSRKRKTNGSLKAKIDEVLKKAITKLPVQRVAVSSRAGLDMKRVTRADNGFFSLLASSFENFHEPTVAVVKRGGDASGVLLTERSVKSPFPPAAFAITANIERDFCDRALKRFELNGLRWILLRS